MSQQHQLNGLVEGDFRIELLKDMAESWNRGAFQASKSPRNRHNRVETTHIVQELS